MGDNRGHLFSAFAGLIIGAVLMSVFPAVAGNGDDMVLGQKNTAITVTRLNTRGGLRIDNFKSGNTALILNTVGTTPPMQVSSNGLVANLNADLLDGQEASAFAGGGHDHDTDYLGVGGTAYDSSRLGGYPASRYLGHHVVAADGLPSLGVGCLDRGGALIGFLPNGYPNCSRPGGTGYFDMSPQDLGSSTSVGISLGDLDGDGDLDAFVANSGVNSDKVWLNDGGGIYSDSGQSLATADSREVELGDLDGDGDLDALVSGQSGSVWVNDGAGTFTDSGQTFGPGVDVGLGDIDGDGDLDAVFASNLPYAVWVNDGSGTFTDSGQALAHANNGYGVALGDLDGDGDLDAFFSDGGANLVFTNDGSGTFTDSEQSLGTDTTYGATLGDLDGDGDLDAFTANNGGNRVWLNGGTGFFTDSGQSLGIAITYVAVLGDFDGDGDLDAGAVTSSGTPNRVWLNNGAGTFAPSGQELGTATGQRVDTGDVDGDGDLDLFFTNSGSGNWVYLGGLEP